MTAQDYGVNNPYNPPSHNGKDRAMPVGTQVFKGNSSILSGNSGKSTGPHLHTQAGTDKACQKVFDPTPLEFKSGVVVAFRATDPYKPGVSGGEWGKYVTLQVDNRFITYAHLSAVNVKVGDVISQGEPMFNEGDRENVNNSLYGEDKGKFKSLVGKSYHDAMYGIFDGEEFKADYFVNDGDVVNINTAIGRDDAQTVKGKNWKEAGYGYFMQIKPTPVPPADEYVQVTDISQLGLAIKKR